MPFGGVSHFGDQNFHFPGTEPWQYAFELRTLSVTYPRCMWLNSYAATFDNVCEKCPTIFKYFWLFFFHQSYIILPGGCIIPVAQWLSRVVMTRYQTCNLQMRDLAVNPTCLLFIASWLAIAFTNSNGVFQIWNKKLCISH